MSEPEDFISGKSISWTKYLRQKSLIKSVDWPRKCFD